MPPLTSPICETFAQALARGANAPDAARTAGYRRVSHGFAVAQRPRIVARVKEIQERIAWGGSRELASVIDLLMQTAIDARNLESAAALTAATRALVEAARLKLQLPRDEETAPAAPIVDEILTDEEWIARYGESAPP